jgi:transposase InsO family protein
MILGLVDEAVTSGARQFKACELLGIDCRTLQRWRSKDIGEDGRAGPKTSPGNKLAPKERAQILEIANLPEHRDLSPKQLVPKLADEGIYLASESTIYRILREADQQKNRERSRSPQKRHRPKELMATGPNQVWSWDITYMKSPVRGTFFYLYLVVDVWSRKIVGWAVHESESAEHASELMMRACAREGVCPDQLALHSDNGGPMKGATILATLQALGIVTSFSRPSVSDDNPFSEALFRTVKYRPEYPSGPFASLEVAHAWVTWFVRWYNTEHQHSAVCFVTPEERHSGRDVAILETRHAVYEAARARHPERWSGKTRNWSRVEIVTLNPDSVHAASEVA